MHYQSFVCKVQKVIFGRRNEKPLVPKAQNEKYPFKGFFELSAMWE